MSVENRLPSFPEMGRTLTALIALSGCSDRVLNNMQGQVKASLHAEVTADEGSPCEQVPYSISARTCQPVMLYNSDADSTYESCLGDLIVSSQSTVGDSTDASGQVASEAWSSVDVGFKIGGADFQSCYQISTIKLDTKDLKIPQRADNHYGDLDVEIDCTLNLSVEGGVDSRRCKVKSSEWYPNSDTAAEDTAAVEGE